jgi:hypothetical protein
MWRYHRTSKPPLSWFLCIPIPAFAHLLKHIPHPFRVDIPFIPDARRPAHLGQRRKKAPRAVRHSTLMGMLGARCLVVAREHVRNSSITHCSL